MLKSDVKKHAVLYGIFLGIFVGIFAFLILMTFLSRNSWKNGLASSVQTVLNNFEKDTYTVNKFIDLNSPISTSAAAYSLIKKGAPSNEIYYGIIIRIPTITGPAPAVFIYNGKKSLKQTASFAGFCEDFGKASALADERLSVANISYWESVVPKVIEKSLQK